MRALVAMGCLASACGGGQATRYAVTTTGEAEQTRFARTVDDAQVPPRDPWDMTGLGPIATDDPLSAPTSVNTPSITSATLPIDSEDVRIGGQVIASTDYQPLAGVRVTVPRAGQVLTAVSDQEGMFAIVAHDKGNYRLTARYGARSANTRFWAGPGTAVHVQVVMPPHPPGVHFLAQDPCNEKLAGLCRELVCNNRSLARRPGAASPAFDVAGISRCTRFELGNRPLPRRGTGR